MSFFPPVTPHHNERRATMLIIHGTEVDDATSRKILGGQSEHQGSCHYYIDPDGNVVQYLDETVRAWHAGVAYWAGFTDINGMSIGIELMAISKNRKFDGDDTVYTDAQMNALIELSQGILQRNKILPHHVLAHQDVSCTREFEPVPADSLDKMLAEQPVGRQKKYDPGPHFNWQIMAENGIGLWHGLTPDTNDSVITDQASIDLFSTNLALFGYDMRGEKGKNLPSVLRAFQTHFLPWNICGQVTEQSVTALNVLLAKKLA